MSEMSVMECVDLSDNEDTKQSSGLEDPEMYDILGVLPGSQRYVACIAASATMGLVILDLYKRRTVRLIETGKSLYLALCL